MGTSTPVDPRTKIFLNDTEVSSPVNVSNGDRLQIELCASHTYDTETSVVLHFGSVFDRATLRTVEAQYDVDVDAAIGSRRRSLLATKSLNVTGLKVFDTNDAFIPEDQLSFDFDAATNGMRDFTSFDDRLTDMYSLLEASAQDRQTVVWDLGAGTTTLFAVRSVVEIGSVDIETDAEDETTNLRFMRKRWGGQTSTDSAYMRRYVGLFSKVGDWHRRRFYDFRIADTETNAYVGTVVPVLWGFPVSFDTSVFVQISVTQIVKFSYSRQSHNVYQMRDEQAYADCDFIGAELVQTNFQIPMGGNYYFSCQKPGHCAGGLKLHVEALPLPQPPSPPPPSPSPPSPLPSPSPPPPSFPPPPSPPPPSPPPPSPLPSPSPPPPSPLPSPSLPPPSSSPPPSPPPPSPPPPSPLPSPSPPPPSPLPSPSLPPPSSSPPPSPPPSSPPPTFEATAEDAAAAEETAAAAAEELAAVVGVDSQTKVAVAQEEAEVTAAALADLTLSTTAEAANLTATAVALIATNAAIATEVAAQGAIDVANIATTGITTAMVAAALADRIALNAALAADAAAYATSQTIANARLIAAAQAAATSAAADVTASNTCAGLTLTPSSEAAIATALTEGAKSAARVAELLEASRNATGVVDDAYAASLAAAAAWRLEVVMQGNDARQGAVDVYNIATTGITTAMVAEQAAENVIEVAARAATAAAVLALVGPTITKENVAWGAYAAAKVIQRNQPNLCVNAASAITDATAIADQAAAAWAALDQLLAEFGTPPFPTPPPMETYRKK